MDGRVRPAVQATLRNPLPAMVGGVSARLQSDRARLTALALVKAT